MHCIFSGIKNLPASHHKPKQEEALRRLLLFPHLDPQEKTEGHTKLMSLGPMGGLCNLEVERVTFSQSISVTLGPLGGL